jgi:hypothetical protein
MSGKSISIERPPRGRAFAVSVAPWAMAMEVQAVVVVDAGPAASRIVKRAAIRTGDR